MSKAEHLFIRYKTIGMSTCKGRKPQSLMAAVSHNQREKIHAGGSAYGRIDSSSTNLNYSIVNSGSAADVASKAAALMEQAGKNPASMRRDYCQAIEVVFSLPANTTKDVAAYFSDCVAWLGRRYGTGVILTADVHLDQECPHCHALMVPVNGGRYVGREWVERGALMAAVGEFAETVAKPHGLSMPERLDSAQRRAAIAMVLQALEAVDGGVFLRPWWQPMRAAIERDTISWLESLGLEVQARKPKKLKTMAKTFISKGKGPKTETQKRIGIESKPSKAMKGAQPIPIRFSEGGNSSMPILCVGFAFPASLLQAHTALSFPVGVNGRCKRMSPVHAWA